MGWESWNATHWKNGAIDRKAECDGVYRNVIKSVMVGSVYYAACRVKDVNGNEIVTAAVALTSVDSKDYYNFSIKVMDESMGPNEQKCPESILKLLSPTESEWANEWRAGCRKYHAERKAAKKNPLAFANLPMGAKVLWTVGSSNWCNLEKGEQLILEKAKLYNSPRARAYWIDYDRRKRFQPKDIPLSEIVLHQD